jgi:predicted lipoprotein with Yx(FWY)xxD motif
MRRLALLPLAAAAVLAAGCGDSSDDDGRAMTQPGDGAMAAQVTGNTMTGDDAMRDDAMKSGAATAARARGTIVKVVSSQYGRVLADGTGEALYLFDKERSPRSQCYGDCATSWPPVLARGTPRAGRGTRAGLLGTTRRRDGRMQVTYAGRPLYYYVHDDPGLIRCHDVFEYGGTWLVVKPDGRAAA